MITIVTGNTTKFSEMQRALIRHGVECSRENAELPEIQTMKQLDAVKQKALDAFAAMQKPILVDDSGFFVSRYNAFPGVLSKYIYKMLGYEGLFRLLEEGENAYFQCSVAYMDATLEKPQIFTAQWPGRVTKQFDPVTTDFKEMPYVPLFVPDEQPLPGQPKALAFFTPDERIHDHRHSALAAFAEWYQSR